MASVDLEGKETEGLITVSCKTDNNLMKNMFFLSLKYLCAAFMLHPPTKELFSVKTKDKNLDNRDVSQ